MKGIDMKKLLLVGLVLVASICAMDQPPSYTAIENEDFDKLLTAIRGDQLSQVETIIVRFPALVNKTQNDGATPLHIAAYQGHLAIVKYLVQKGANINQATPHGATPLSVAAQQGHLAIVKYLVQKGANINQAMTNGATPLSVAAENGHLDVVKYLVQNGAFTSTLWQNKSPEDIAREKGYTQIVDVLKIAQKNELAGNTNPCKAYCIAHAHAGSAQTSTSSS
jgi:ankyrin repeat protein